MGVRHICENCGCTVYGRATYPHKDGPKTLCTGCRRERTKHIEREENRVRSRGNALKRKLIEERGKRCEICGATPKQIHGHHIKPLRDGGQNTPDNIQLLCKKCHAKSHPNGTRH